MKNCVKKWIRRISIWASIILIAGITSIITTRKTVWITLKRREEN